MSATWFSPKCLRFEVSRVDGGGTRLALGERALVVACSMEGMARRWEQWRAGAHVQVAFDNLSVDEREFLLTGLTPVDWNALFPQDDDDRCQYCGRPECRDDAETACNAKRLDLEESDRAEGGDET